MSEDQNRAHPRFAVELDAEVETADGLAKGATQNISKGGFCFEAPEGLTAGKHGTARMALVFEEGQFSERLELECQVAWCTKRANGTFQIGVRFLELSPEMDQYLSIFIRYLEEPEEE